MEEVPFYKKEKNYQTVERALKILEIIRTFSDEENTITQRKIMDEMMDKGESVNERTISSTIRKLLEALNKESNNDRDTHKYRILYNGCDNKNRKMQHISGLRYVHDFSFEELDTIISTMYLSKELSGKDRDNLICKLAKLSSKNYYNKWVSENNNNPIIKKVFQDISENNNASKTELRKNIGIISEAIECKKKVCFVFNGYDANKQLKPTIDSDDKVVEYVVTPYHIITYNGKYYLICNKDNKNNKDNKDNKDKNDNVSIWRIDLMTEMKILKDSVGRLKSEVKGLPSDNNYNKFMSEHLNMFYDEPKDIRLKVRKDRYTVLYDWFGENFEVWRKPTDDDEYALVMVTTSPNAIVNFAMQYSDIIQVVGPDEVVKQIQIKCNNILKRISESKK